MKKAEYGLTGDFIFKEAVEFLKKKIPLKLGEYREISDECKGKAFTVSGYTSLEVLQKYEGLNPFNADVIFRTNMQTAYNAGHYKSMTNPTTKKLRPFWKYITAGDGEVRESHAQMEGRIYPADDPIWDIWYPPNGFRCRCTVVSLTKSQAEREKAHISKGLPSLTLKTTLDDGTVRTGLQGLKVYMKPDLTGIDSNLKSAFRERQQKNNAKTG